jgi:hypothetical protein
MIEKTITQCEKVKLVKASREIQHQKKSLSKVDMTPKKDEIEA